MTKARDLSKSTLPAQSGNSGKYLTTDGTDQSWGTVSSGGMTLIATGTMSASSLLTFSSIPTDYKELKLVWANIYADSEAGTRWMYVRLNNDGTSIYNYRGYMKVSTQIQIMDTTQSNFGHDTRTAVINAPFASATDYAQNSYGSMTISNANQTTNSKIVQWGSSANNFDGYGAINFWGAYRGTSAVSQIDFIANAGTFNGKIYLYGVK